jgi:hypothetical protein
VPDADAAGSDDEEWLARYADADAGRLPGVVRAVRFLGRSGSHPGSFQAGSTLGALHLAVLVQWWVHPGHGPCLGLPSLPRSLSAPACLSTPSPPCKWLMHAAASRTAVWMSRSHGWPTLYCTHRHPLTLPPPACRPGHFFKVLLLRWSAANGTLDCLQHMDVPMGSPLGSPIDIEPLPSRSPGAYWFPSHLLTHPRQPNPPS